MSLDGARLRYEDENGKVVVLAAKGRTFQVGSYFNCDLTIEDPQEERLLCEIKCDAFGRVNIYNKSSQEPIHLNDQVFHSCNGKRPLLHGCRITIRDKVYIWEFPKTSEAQDEPSTPKSTTSTVEQASNSCPAPKQSHRLQIDKRLTVHNFHYSINSDDEGNTSIESRDQNESLLEEDSLDFSTPSSSNTTACETPKVNLLEATQNKENTATPPGSHQKLLQLCALSDVVITSFSPRETGVKVEKSFTCVRKPVKAAKTVSTPKSVYSTPKGGVLSELNEDSCSRDLMDFCTPSTSKKAKRASSMHLIDLTTPSKLRPTPKQTPTSITVDSTDESSDASPLVIDITNSATPPSSGPLHRNNTPRRPGGTTGATPKRTPQSLMKRALLTSTKKQITANQTDKTTPVANAKRTTPPEARRQCLTTPRRLPFHPVRRTPLQRPEEKARGKAPNTSPRKRKTLLESPRDNKVSQLRKSFAAAKRSPGVDKSNKLVAKARRSLNSPKSGSPKPASPCPRKTFNLPRNKCSTPEKLDDSKDELSRTFTIMDETEGREQSERGSVIEAVAALITGDMENDVSIKLAPEVFDSKISSVEEQVKSISPANEKTNELQSEVEKVNSKKDDVILENEPNDVETAHIEELSKSPSDANLQDEEKIETLSIQVKEKTELAIIEDSICDEVHANIPKQTNAANPDKIFEDNICEEVLLETKLGDTSTKRKEQTANVDTPSIRRSLRKLSVDQRAVTTTPRRSSRRSSVDANKKVVSEDNSKRTRRASCSALESQEVSTPRRKRRFTQEMSTPTRQSKRLMNTPKRENQVDESVGDMGVILEEGGPVDEENSAIADDENYGNELIVDNTDNVDYHGLKDLLKTPKNCSTPRFKGLREMMRTPKNPASPILGNLAELLETSAGSTPYHKGRSSTAADVEQGKTLEGILKTPSARNIMVPIEPASAVLKSREGSLAATTEYDLNMTNTTLHLDKIFDDVPETTGPNMEDTEAEINVTALSTATGVDPLGSSKLNESVPSEALMTDCNTATGASFKDPLTSTTYKASMQTDHNLSAFTDTGSRTASPNPNEMSGIQLLDQTSDSMFFEPLIVTGVESSDVTVDETRASSQTIPPADNIEDRSDTDSNVGLTEPLVFSDDEEESEKSETTPKKHTCFGETSTAYKLQESGDLRGNKSVTETSVNDKKMDSVSEVSLIEVEDTTIEGSSISVSNPIDDVTQDEKSLVIELDKFRDKGEPGQENNESAVVELTILESEIFPLDSTAGCSVISSNVSNCSEVDLPNVDLKPLDSKTTNLGDVKTTEVSIEGTKEDDVSHLDLPQSEHEKTTDVKTDQPVTEKLFTERVAKECKDLSLGNTAETNESKLTSEKRPGENKPDEGACDAATDQLVIKTSPVHEHPEEHIDADQPIIETSISEKHSENTQSDEVSTDVMTAPADKLPEKSQSYLPLEKQTNAETDQLVIKTTPPAEEFPEESKPEKTTDSETDQLVIETLPADELPEESTSDLLLEKKPDGENESTHTEVLLEESTTSAAAGDSEVLGQTQELLPKDVIQNCGSCPIGDTSISKAIDEDSAIDRNESVVDSAEDSGALSKSQEKQENSAKEETSIDETAKYTSSPSSTVEIEHSEVVDSPENSTGVDNATATKGATPTPRDFSVTDKNNDDQLNGATVSDAADQSSDKQEHLNEKDKDIIEGVPKDSISVETSRNVNSTENLQVGIQEPSSPKSEPDSKAFKSTPLDKNVPIEEEEEPSKEVKSAQEAEKSYQNRPKEEIHMAESTTDYQTSKDECSQIDERITDQANEDSILEEACGQPKVPSDQEETDSVVVQLDATKSVFEQTTLNECSLMEEAGENQSNEDSYMEKSSGSDRTNGDQGEAEKCEQKEALNKTEDEVILDGSSLTEVSASDQPKDVSILSEPSCFEKTKEDKELNKEEVKKYGPDDEVIQLDASSIVNQTPLDGSLLASNQFNEECILEDKPKMSGTMNKEEAEKCVPKESPNQNGPDDEVIELDTSRVVEESILVENSLIECSVTEEHNKDFTSVESSNFNKTKPISVTDQKESETSTGKSYTDHGVEVVVQNVEIKDIEKPADLHKSTDTESHKETDEQLSFVKKSSVNECYQDVLSVTAEVSTSAPEIALNVSNSNIQVIIAAQADNSKRAANYFVRQTEGDVPSAKAEEQEALVQETEKDEGEIIGELKEIPKAQAQSDDQQIDEKLSLQKKISEVIQSEKYEVIDLDDSSSSAQGHETMPQEAFENKESDAPKARSAALLDTEPQVSDKLAQPKLVEEFVTAAKKNDERVTTYDTTLNELKEEGVAPPTLTTLQKYDVIDLDDSSSSAQGPETSSIENIDEIEFVASKESTSASVELATEEPEEPNNLTDPAFAKESVTFTTSKDNLGNLQKNDFAPSEPRTKPIIIDDKVALTEQLDVIDLDDSSSSAQGPETRPIEAIKEKESFASNTSTSTGVPTEKPQGSQQVAKPLLAEEFVTVTATDPVPAKESVTMTSAKKIEVKATTSEDHFDNIEKTDFAPSEPKTKTIITDEKVALTEQLDVIDLDDSSSSAQGPETTPIEDIKEKESFASNAHTSTGQLPTENPQVSEQVAKPVLAEEFNTVTATKNSDLTDPAPAKESDTLTSAKRIAVKATTSEDHFDNIEKDNFAAFEPKTKPIITDEKVALTEKLDVIDLDDSSSSAQGAETKPIEAIKEKESELPIEKPQVSKQVAKPVLAEEFVTVTATKESDEILTSSEATLDTLEEDGNAAETETVPPKDIDEEVALTEKYDIIDLDDSSSSAQAPETKPLDTVDKKEFVASNSNTFVNVSVALPTEEPQASDELANAAPVAESKRRIKTSEGTLDNLKKERIASPEPDTVQEIQDQEKLDKPVVDDHTAEELSAQSKSEHGNINLISETANYAVLLTQEALSSNDNAEQSQINTEKKSSEELDHSTSTGLNTGNKDNILKISNPSISSDKTNVPRQVRKPLNDEVISSDESEARPAKRATRKGSASSDRPAEATGSERMKRRARKPSAEVEDHEKDNKQEDYVHLKTRGRARKPSSEVDESQGDDKTEKREGRGHTPSAEASELIQKEENVEEHKAEENLEPIFEEGEPEVEREESTEGEDNNKKEPTNEKTKKRGRKPLAKEPDATMGKKVNTGDVLEGVHEFENPHEDLSDQAEQQEHPKPVPVVSPNVLMKEEDDPNQKATTIENSKRRGRKASAKETDTTSGKKGKTEHVLESVNEDGTSHSNREREPVPVLSPASNEEEEAKSEVKSKQDPREDENINQKNPIIEKPKRRGRKPSAKETVTSLDRNEKAKDNLKTANQYHLDDSVQEEPQEPMPVEALNLFKEDQETKTEVGPNAYPEKPSRRARKASEDVSIVPDKKHKSEELPSIEKHNNKSKESVKEDLTEVRVERSKRRGRKPSAEEVKATGSNQQNDGIEEIKVDDAIASIQEENKLHSGARKSAEFIPANVQEPVKEDHIERPKRRGRKPSVDIDNVAQQNHQTDDVEEIKVENALTSIQEENKPHSRARKSDEFIPANVQEPAKEDHIERPKRRGRKPSVDIDHVAREVVEKPKRRGRTPAEHEKQLNEDEKQEPALQIVEPEKKTRRNTRKASAETAEAVPTSGEDHLQQIKEATEPGSESEPTPTKTKEKEEHKTRRRGHKPTAETIEEPIKKNSPEIPSHSRRRGRKTSEDETLTTADIAEPKTKLRGGRVSLDQEKEEIQLEVVELPPAKTTRRGRKPSADVATPEKKPPSRRVRNASANIDEGTPVAKKTTNRRGRKEDALDEEPINQIDLQDLPTDSVPATVVTSSSPAKTSDGEELTPRRREGRNLPRKNYEEAPDDEKPHSASRRARKPAASKGLANTAPEPDALTATPVSKQPPIEEDVTPANTGAMPEPTTSQRREGRNLPRKNYTEAPDDDKPTTARGRRVRNLTAKALELIVDSSPRPATPKRPKGKAIEDEGAPAKATQEILPAAEGTTPEDEPVPAAKGRGTRRKADEVGDVLAPASKRGGRGNHSGTDESDQKPAKKNVRATARKAKVETDPEEHPPTKKARGGARAKTPVAVTEESASNQEGEPLKKPAARSRARGAKAAEPEQPHQDSQVEVAASTSATTVRGGRGRKVHFEAAPEVSTSEDAPKRATRSRRK
ncbi:uncharacterized protein LOC108040443 [Drosophila rhopaloa]|uniref:Titin n=1 Tax=Drosophila rhopaloa TaxID=1041015 RepID=A0ABM5J360_DRORH|nr:uncharacterized protein LOC108040443 [Drosophila rhopaloa]